MLSRAALSLIQGQVEESFGVFVDQLVYIPVREPGPPESQGYHSVIVEVIRKPFKTFVRCLLRQPVKGHAKSDKCFISDGAAALELEAYKPIPEAKDFSF